MVFTKFYSFLILVGDCPRVSGVGAVDPIGSDQDDVGSAASMRIFIVLGAVTLAAHLLLNLLDFFLPFFLLEQNVHHEEGFPERVFEFALLIMLILLQFFNEMPLDKSRDLRSWL